MAVNHLLNTKDFVESITRDSGVMETLSKLLIGGTSKESYVPIRSVQTSLDVTDIVTSAPHELPVTVQLTNLTIEVKDELLSEYTMTITEREQLQHLVNRYHEELLYIIMMGSHQPLSSALTTPTTCTSIINLDATS